MNVDHVNAVCRATKTILTNHFGIEVTPLNPSAQKHDFLSNNVSVLLGINGDLSGEIICSIDEQTAINIVSIMMGGLTIEKLDDMGRSAIQEFGNWIAGSTAMELSKQQFVDVTPPVVKEGIVHFQGGKLFITVPLRSTLGLIEVHISLMEQAS
ncbi:chemotaxis protein CheX [Evansella tamaricis]|uniref:Chemotaxis protein CheX n=1 Tax=Evansella tamaricis TaxID=2069301 RepID=A0ABS6JIX4_9BACI|nr:chemotaxis protein CheX [Evansella tamaricis]MBU9713154.1 chemotaxis protein CheX [Evansella tamaricis]